MDRPILCPDKLSFKAEKWPAWKQQFQSFRTASDLSNKSCKMYPCCSTPWAKKLRTY